jgi:Kef-type K+ transport system membrane component KefB
LSGDANPESAESTGSDKAVAAPGSAKVVVTQALPTLALIALGAIIAPIVAELSGRLFLPSVVIEMLYGILIGPYALNIAHTDSLIKALSDLGLTFLIFLAGFELNINEVKGRPLATATATWTLTLAMALGLAFLAVSAHHALNVLVIGLALTTTALGTLFPVLRDRGILSTPLGTHIEALGTVGEFAPVVIVAVLLEEKDPVITLLLLAAFVAIGASTMVIATRPHPPALVSLLRRHLNTSAQLPVRLAVLAVVLLVLLASKLGLDVLLGSFMAGLVARVLTVDEDHQAVQSKLHAIGFGFLIPIFFVVSGIHFDLHILTTQPKALFRLVAFLLLFVVVRAPILVMYRTRFSRADRFSLMLFSATALPLIVVITTIGTSEGKMLPINSAALQGAGIVSVLLYPALAVRRYSRAANRVGDVDTRG